MSGSSISQSNFHSKNVQMKQANLPPSWEIFSTLDVARQQTIYRTMCEQIAQQQKQLAVLNDKLKQNELLASQKIDEAQNKLLEDTFKIKGEIEGYQNQISQKDHQIKQYHEEIERQQVFIDTLNQELKNYQEFAEESKKIPEYNAKIVELKSQLEIKDENINSLRKQIEQLLNTLQNQESQQDEYSKKVDEEFQLLNAQLQDLQIQLNKSEDAKLRWQQEYETIQDRLNSHSDLRQFEQMYQKVFQEFTHIKNNYNTYVQRVKEQEVAIEDLVAENSRLVIEIYNMKN